MSNDLRERFGQAENEMAFGEGSLESVIARADQRTRRTQIAGGATAILIVAVLGFFLFQLINPEPPSEIIDVTNEADTNTESLSSSTLSEADFVYAGTFTAPDVDGESNFEFGGHTIAFNPENDSLFITGFRNNPEVAEISIPDFIAHEGSRTDLVEAELLQPFADITEGEALARIGSVEVGGQDNYRINGLEVVEGDDGPRLHWTATQYQNAVPHVLPGHRHSSLDLSNPDVEGPFFVEGFIAEQTAGYIFQVPQEFADSALGGRSLVSGYQEEVRGFTSRGAPFFAFDVPGSVVTEGTVEATELVNYEFPEEESEFLASSMRVPGADWVSTPDGRSAIVTVGNSMNLDVSEDCRFGRSTDVSAHSPQMSLYDPADLAAVAAGTSQPSEVEPYLVISLEDDVIPVCGAQLGAIAFDAENNRLFVVQESVTANESDFDARPAIHVFTVG